jgi:hypothetical protein
MMSNSAEAVKLKPTQRSGIFGGEMQTGMSLCLSTGSISINVVNASWDKTALTKKVSKQSWPYLFLSYKHYPFLTVVMHRLNLAALVLFLHYLITDHPIIHPVVLIWGIVGFGGMTIVLWKAATEIEQHRQ